MSTDSPGAVQGQGALLVCTFIYTRCPSPEFCPRVTRNFAAVEKELAASPKVYVKTHLICVSFDPENDTPERLRAYGATYIGSDAKTAFAHWDFAVPDKAVLGEMARYFDLGMTSDAEGNDYPHALDHADWPGRQSGALLSGE